MRFTAEELNTVLLYIKEHADRGVFTVESYPSIAAQTGLRAGRVAAVFYFLCGEGKILQEGKTVLLLENTLYEDGAVL